MATLLADQARVARLDDYFLALLCTKRASIFPLRHTHDYAAWEDSNRHTLARKKVIDRVVPPMYPTRPLVGMYPETRVPMAEYYTGSIPPLPARSERLGHAPDGTAVWFGFRRRSTQGLRNLFAPLKTSVRSVPYETHLRIIYPDGAEFYEKEVLAVCHDCVVPYILPLHPGFHITMDHLIEYGLEQFKELASQTWFQDHMQRFWQLHWSYAGKQLIFPATERAVKELASLREGPRTTPSGRRNPLLHWVTEHLRRVHSEPERLIPVTEHLRGTERFVLGEYAAEILNPVRIS